MKHQKQNLSRDKVARLALCLSRFVYLVTALFVGVAMPYKDKAKKREYDQRYYTEHREKRRGQGRQYHIEHREKENKRSHQYHVAHRKELNEKTRQYRDEHPEVVRAREARYRVAHWEEIRRRSIRYRVAHWEEIRGYYRQYCKEHPEQIRQYSNQRRARKLNAPIVEDIDRTYIFGRDKGRCHLCGKKVDTQNWHLDHVIPLTKGGEHSNRNVAIAHPSCNQKKNNKIVPCQLKLIG